MKDIVIIGSGFGGAVLAARLGAWAQLNGATIEVVEQGDDPTGRFDPLSEGPALNSEGNRFRHTLSPSTTARWADVYTDPDATFKAQAPSLNVVAGRGLGGGSNVYSGVSIRAPRLAFEQTDDSGRRLWPSLYNRAALDPHYARVEAALKVCQLAWTDQNVPHWQLAAKRDYIFAEGCRRIGATALPLKVATHEDKNEGWWTTGQRFEGRQSLTKNYLELARLSGVTFRTGSTVRTIEKGGPGYVVRGVDRRGGREVDFEIETKTLFVCTGAVPSTALLLRSQLDLDTTHLGLHLSGNGDYGVAGVIGEGFGEVEGQKGKPISSFCPSFFAEHQFLILPFYAEPLYLALGRISTLQRPQEPDRFGRGVTEPAAGETDWGLAHKKTPGAVHLTNDDHGLFGARQK